MLLVPGCRLFVMLPAAFVGGRLLLILSCTALGRPRLLLVSRARSFFGHARLDVPDPEGSDPWNHNCRSGLGKRTGRMAAGNHHRVAPDQKRADTAHQRDRGLCHSTPMLSGRRWKPVVPQSINLGSQGLASPASGRIAWKAHQPIHSPGWRLRHRSEPHEAGMQVLRFVDSDLARLEGRAKTTTRLPAGATSRQASATVRKRAET
jgi:hypothetical protein